MSCARAYNFSDYRKILKIRSLAVGDQETMLRRRPAAHLTYKYPEQGSGMGKTLFSERVFPTPNSRSRMNVL